jgi:hypothetical protein
MATDDAIDGRKCVWCKKTLPLEAFPAHATTGVPLSRCAVCNAKHAVSGHANRAAKAAVRRSAARRATQGPTGIERKKCRYCSKEMALTAFSMNDHTGKPFSRCENCRPKHSATSHAGRKRGRVPVEE